MRILALLIGLALLPGSANALQIEVRAASIEHPALPQALRDLRMRCDLDAGGDETRCVRGRFSLRVLDQAIAGSFDARHEASGAMALNARTQLRNLTFSDASGRYASEKLEAALQLDARLQEQALRTTFELSLPAGQAYAEPVFLDFSQSPMRLRGTLLRHPDGRVDASGLQLAHEGVVQASGSLHWRPGDLPEMQVDFRQLRIARAFETWVQPFLVGTQLEQLQLEGQASGTLQTDRDGVSAARVQLRDSNARYPAWDVAVNDLRGGIDWRRDGEADASSLQWDALALARLKSEASSARFRLHRRGLELLSPLRLPLAGGALRVRDFAVREFGQPQMQARLDAVLDPLDLAQLCRALGWPEFGGTLAGALPGLRLEGGNLDVDGALTAQAFDGHVAVTRLRVLDVFGRVPRVAANVALRNLDLAELTGAFSFGRIEGRLDGDVQDLRLRRWQPVAFRARIETPADDRSRHRISQRAIDNISSLGGGPSGVLSRGFLRFFDDFAYERIGWSCTLVDGECRMSGLGPAPNGGFVIVRGRWLPRIDVIGYNARVDWNTFVSQLSAAAQGGAPELR